MRNQILKFLKLVLLFLSYLVRRQNSQLKTEQAWKRINEVYDFDLSANLFHITDLKDNTLDISFIIPVYNRESFVEQCIRSICNQKTSVHYEVICIDDGSSDNTLDILKKLQIEYSEKLIVISQENKGISDTRNKGIEMASGEYIGFIDSDDFVSNDYIEKIWQKKLDTNADFIQVAYKYTDENGIETNTLSNKNFTCDENGKCFHLTDVYGFGAGGIQQKELFKNIRFPRDKKYEDIIKKMLLFRLCKKFASISTTYYYIRRHSIQESKILSKTKNVYCLDHLYLIFRLINYGNNKLYLSQGETLSLLILNELNILGSRIRGLPNNLQEAAFVIGAYLWNQHKSLTSNIKVNEQLNRMAYNYNGKHFYKWKIDNLINIVENLTIKFGK